MTPRLSLFSDVGVKARTVVADDEVSFTASTLQRGVEYNSNYSSYGRGNQVDTLRSLGELPKIRSALFDLFGTRITPHSVIEAVILLGAQNLVGVQWKGATCSRHFRNVRLRIRVGVTVLLDVSFENQCFPASPRGILWSEPLTLGGAVTVTFELAGQVRNLLLPLPDWIETTAETMLADMHQQTAHDVCFVFAGSNRELWTSEKMLTTSSPYYTALLTSKFGEGLCEEGVVRKPSEEDAIKQRDFEDSDDETDDLLHAKIIRDPDDDKHDISGPLTNDESDKETCERFGLVLEYLAANNLSPPNCTPKETRAPASPYRRVVVKEAAYTTYAAMLVWLSCRHIEFASLRSKLQRPRKEEVEQFAKEHPHLPAPVSPKSVYRLAHLLELEELQEVAVRDFAAQLTSDNVVKELFSDVASSYKELRDTALDVTARDWPAARLSAGWAEVESLADQNLLPPGAAHTALLLAARVK